MRTLLLIRYPCTLQKWQAEISSLSIEFANLLMLSIICLETPSSVELLIPATQAASTSNTSNQEFDTTKHPPQTSTTTQIPRHFPPRPKNSGTLQFLTSKATTNKMTHQTLDMHNFASKMAKTRRTRMQNLVAICLISARVTTAMNHEALDTHKLISNAEDSDDEESNTFRNLVNFRRINDQSESLNPRYAQQTHLKTAKTTRTRAPNLFAI